MISQIMDRDEESYPRLMKSVMTGGVVLFESRGKGTVVYPGDAGRPSWNIGYSSNDWHMESFVDFRGTVTLTN